VSILEGREKQHDVLLQEQAAKTKEKAAELERLTKQLQVSCCCAVRSVAFAAAGALHTAYYSAAVAAGAWSSLLVLSLTSTAFRLLPRTFSRVVAAQALCLQ
jgi:hypothetical protein